MLGQPDLRDGDEGCVRIIGFKSGIIKRICRSTFRDEAHGMLYATEASDKLGTVLSSLRDTLTRSKNWEFEVASQLPNLWLADCKSLHDYLVNPVRAGCQDKRLKVDLGGLRGDLSGHGDELGTLQDFIDGDQKTIPPPVL